jgi:hypothetical protein
MAKTLKRKNRKFFKKKINKSRKFKKLSKKYKKSKTHKSSKKHKRSKKLRGGAQRFGVMPALANTNTKLELDEEGNLVQTKNVSDQTPIHHKSSFSTQGSNTTDFNTGVRNINSEMSKKLRKNVAGEPTTMTIDEIQKEASTRRQIQELKSHSNPLKRLQGHMWSLVPRTQTENRLRQTADQSLVAAADNNFIRPSFNGDYDYNGSESETKSETKSEMTDPLKITEV